MERIMAVYDVDLHYADRFADVANQKEAVPFTVMAFTTLEQLKNYAAEHSIEILLIGAGVPRETVKLLPVAQIMLLQEGEAVTIKDEYPSVYKYQSSDNIIREVMACYCEKPVYQGIRGTGLGKTCQIIGVYSPVGRCLKTSFALTLGQLLGKNEKTLYISLEAYSGFRYLMEEGAEYKGDLSDVLYFYRQGGCSLLRVKSLVYSLGALDYIPPVRFPEDLSQVTAQEMAGVLTKIAAEAGYQVMIVDVGSFGGQIRELLEICDYIYMPVKEDSISAAKLEEFEAVLDTSGGTGLKERISKLKLPYHSSFGRKENYMEQLLWGELGDYVRQILKGPAYPC